MSHLDPALEAVARAHGVATSYVDAYGQTVEVPAPTVVSVLAAMDVDASTPAKARASHREAYLHAWRRLVAPTVVAREGCPTTVEVHAPDGSGATARVVCEDGTQLAATEEPYYDSRIVDGVPVQEHRFSLPGLPCGWHRLVVESGERSEEATLIVAPDRVPLPTGLGRTWGWMVQLYSLRSWESWGMGDYADLATLATWSGRELGAGVLLVNPLHAPSPLVPVEPSPYYPSSRRFASPLYLRPQALSEYAAAPDAVREEVDRLGVSVPRGDLIDRDAVWTAKLSALQMLFPFREQREEPGEALLDFATWSALAEVHGGDWQEWPVELRRPHSSAVATARAELAERVAFHVWLQQCCESQIAAAQQAAREAGMVVGIVHDLAVGVDPGGADAWALQDALGTATIGAPPDTFNQLGQDWRLPPWSPDALAELGYAPLRDMLRATLARGGGIRVDHVMGLFRLWWIPSGHGPAEGSYVQYDEEAMLAVLALECSRAGALVVGEDLGTVAPEVASALAGRGILGSDVLWFQHEADNTTPLAARWWREMATASATTHDLPTVAGFWADEGVRVRAERGLLGRPVEVEYADAAAARAALVHLLWKEGVIGDAATPEDLVLGVHLLLTRTPARVVLMALGDVVGDLRQPNLPGTVDEYPNWRLPVADATGRELTLEELMADPRVLATARAVAQALR